MSIKTYENPKVSHFAHEITKTIDLALSQPVNEVNVNPKEHFTSEYLQLVDELVSMYAHTRDKVDLNQKDLTAYKDVILKIYSTLFVDYGNYISGNINNLSDNIQANGVELATTLINKNADYGDSFSEVVKSFGVPGALMRVYDKANRLKSLTKEGTIKVKDESIADTMLDALGYLALILNYGGGSYED